MTVLAPGVCRDCRSCRSTAAAKGAYALAVAPVLFLTHVATMGLTLMFQRKCPVCRHRLGRHDRDIVAAPVVVVTDPAPAAAPPVPPVTVAERMASAQERLEEQNREMRGVRAERKAARRAAKGA